MLEMCQSAVFDEMNTDPHKIAKHKEKDTLLPFFVMALEDCNRPCCECCRNTVATYIMHCVYLTHNV